MLLTITGFTITGVNCKITLIVPFNLSQVFKISSFLWLSSISEQIICFSSCHFGFFIKIFMISFTFLSNISLIILREVLLLEVKNCEFMHYNSGIVGSWFHVKRSICCIRFLSVGWWLVDPDHIWYGSLRVYYVLFTMILTRLINWKRLWKLS